MSQNAQLKMKFLNKDNLEDAKVLHSALYADIDRIIKLPISQLDALVWDLVAWGIQARQPFGNCYSKLS